MRIVIAPDKFKGSLSAAQAAAAMEKGVLLSDTGAEVEVCPMADGGEGTVEAIAAATGAEVRESRVRGPLPGQEVVARWALVPPAGARLTGAGEDLSGLLRRDEPLAVIEMAQASGFSLVPVDRRDPMVTSTFGTGELVLQALEAGCRQIIVGVGGSGTVDGGTGMAAALGFRFLDAGGNELTPGGACLEKIDVIDGSGRDPRLVQTRFVVASDVDNPLTGPEGAAGVFGPQKGATPEQVAALERGLENLARLLHDRGMDVHDVPGAGAAGGLGAGLVGFCGATIVSGVQLIAVVTGLGERIAGADLVLTGEGSYDSQTAHGKTPAGVAAIARQAGVPVVILAGSIAPGSMATDDIPAFSFVPGPMSLEDAMREAELLVVSGTERLMDLLTLLSRRDEPPAPAG
jgi:glycerate kinase